MGLHWTEYIRFRLVALVVLLFVGLAALYAALFGRALLVEFSVMPPKLKVELDDGDDDAN